jgi:HPt (histidine-containing phosphotransfer) domain-containing protein
MMIAEQKMFDLSFLEEMNDTNFLIQVIGLYLEDTPKDLAEMKQALDIPDASIIARSAHKLKSSTGMLQATKLYSVLEQTETIAKSGSVSPQLFDLVNKTNLEFDVLKTALRLHLQTL